MSSSLARYGAFSRRIRVVAVISSLAFATVSFAQWPTSYTSPKIIGGGTNVRAAAVKSTDAGGVYVAYDNINVATRNVIVGKYSPAGEQLFTNVDTSESVLFSERLRLLDAPGDAEFRVMIQSALESPGAVSGISYRTPVIDSTGQWSSFESSVGYIPLDAVNVAGSNYAVFVENFMSRKITVISNGDGIDATLNLGYGVHIGDAEFVHFGNTGLICYTRTWIQPGTPGEVWNIAWSGEESPNEFLAPKQIHALPGADQSNIHLTLLDDSTAMATWLEDFEGHKNLYASVRNRFGDEVSAPRDCYTDVVDYVTTMSTLGIPVFAAVTRTSDYPVQEALVGGLLNPANGGTATIPISNVVGVKIKALRQEANGDFSLLYSEPENGTNLLKVRRISGVSASTLWETTVADLGRASDEIIANYPNTWVTGTPEGVLYIIARYDEPGTANSSFQLVRLRADGTLGAD